MDPPQWDPAKHRKDPEATRDDRRELARRTGRAAGPPGGQFIDSGYTTLLSDEAQIHISPETPLLTAPRRLRMQPFPLAREFDGHLYQRRVGQLEGGLRNRLTERQRSVRITRLDGSPVYLTVAMGSGTYVLRLEDGTTASLASIVWDWEYADAARRDELAENLRAARVRDQHHYDTLLGLRTALWRLIERRRQLGLIRAEWAAGNTRIFRPEFDEVALRRAMAWVNQENWRERLRTFEGGYPATYNGRPVARVVYGRGMDAAQVHRLHLVLDLIGAPDVPQATMEAQQLRLDMRNLEEPEELTEEEFTLAERLYNAGITLAIERDPARWSAIADGIQQANDVDGPAVMAAGIAEMMPVIQERITDLIRMAGRNRGFQRTPQQAALEVRPRVVLALRRTFNTEIQSQRRQNDRLEANGPPGPARDAAQARIATRIAAAAAIPVGTNRDRIVMQYLRTYIRLYQIVLRYSHQVVHEQLPLQLNPFSPEHILHANLIPYDDDGVNLEDMVFPHPDVDPHQVNLFPGLHGNAGQAPVHPGVPHHHHHHHQQQPAPGNAEDDGQAGQALVAPGPLLHHHHQQQQPAQGNVEDDGNAGQAPVHPGVPHHHHHHHQQQPAPGNAEDDGQAGQALVAPGPLHQQQQALPAPGNAEDDGQAGQAPVHPGAHQQPLDGAGLFLLTRRPDPGNPGQFLEERLRIEELGINGWMAQGVRRIVQDQERPYFSHNSQVRCLHDSSRGQIRCNIHCIQPANADNPALDHIFPRRTAQAHANDMLRMVEQQTLDVPTDLRLPGTSSNSSDSADEDEDEIMIDVADSTSDVRTGPQSPAVLPRRDHESATSNEDQQMFDAREYLSPIRTVEQTAAVIPTTNHAGSEGDHMMTMEDESPDEERLYHIPGAF